MSDVVRRKLLDADHPIGIKKKCLFPLGPRLWSSIQNGQRRCSHT